MEVLAVKNRRILKGFIEGKDISNQNAQHARERIGIYNTPDIQKQLLGMKKDIKEFKKYIGIAVSNLNVNKGGFKPFEFEFGNVINGNGVNDGNNKKNNPAIGHIGNVNLKYAAPVDGGMGHLVIMNDSPHVNTIISKFYEEYGRYFSDTIDIKSVSKSIKSTYEILRLQKSTIEKRKEKDAFKGLNVSTIITVILYCRFVVDKNPMPLPILIKLMNDGLSRGRISKSIKLVTLKQYNEYKDKKLKKYIKKMAPICYNNQVSAPSFIGRFARMLRVPEKLIVDARKLADRIIKENVFGNGLGIDQGVLAIVCLIIVMKKNGFAVDQKDFFIGTHLLAKGTVESVYSKIIQKIPYDNLPNKPF